MRLSEARSSQLPHKLMTELPLRVQPVDDTAVSRGVIGNLLV